MKIFMVFDGSWGSREIEVEIVDIAPHLASVMTFAIGPNPDTGKGWRMHNVETGLCMSTADRPSKAACIEAAKHRLRRITPHIARKRMVQLSKA